MTKIPKRLALQVRVAKSGFMHEGGALMGRIWKTFALAISREHEKAFSAKKSSFLWMSFSITDTLDDGSQKRCRKSSAPFNPIA